MLVTKTNEPLIESADANFPLNISVPNSRQHVPSGNSTSPEKLTRLFVNSVHDAGAGSGTGLTNNRVSFSGEVELPLGTCCREFGTLMFKGKFASADSIKGSLVFVTSIDEEESPYKFHSAVGTFTATRLGK